MEQLFLEFIILVIALFGIFLTFIEICYYRTKNKLYYRVVKLENKDGKHIDIIIPAKDYDENIEETIKKSFSTYTLDKY